MKRNWIMLTSVAAVVPLMALFAEEEPPMSPEGSPWQGLVMVAIAFAFFYFILWRPEQRRRKEIEAKRMALQKGDRVTAMGIIGTVVKIDEQTVILKMVDGSKIEFLKAAISDVLSHETDEAKKSET